MYNYKPCSRLVSSLVLEGDPHKGGDCPGLGGAKLTGGSVGEIFSFLASGLGGLNFLIMFMFPSRDCFTSYF